MNRKKVEKLLDKIHNDDGVGLSETYWYKDSENRENCLFFTDAISGNALKLLTNDYYVFIYAAAMDSKMMDEEEKRILKQYTSGTPTECFIKVVLEDNEH